MIRKIEKIENSYVLVFDDALLQLTQLKEGDQVNVEVASNGTVILSRLEYSQIEEAEAIATSQAIIEENAELFRRLS